MECEWCEVKIIAMGDETCWGKEAICTLDYDPYSGYGNCVGYKWCNNPEKKPPTSNNTKYYGIKI